MDTGELKKSGITYQFTAQKPKTRPENIAQNICDKISEMGRMSGVSLSEIGQISLSISSFAQKRPRPPQLCIKERIIDNANRKDKSY